MTTRLVVKAYVSKEEHESWLGFCKAHKVSSSEALRAAIRKLSGYPKAAIPNNFVAVPEQPDRERKRIYLRLSESEFDKVSMCAKFEGTSITQWFVNLTRARLTREPQYGMNELFVLGESCRQLAAIGTNLNQVAKRLNSHRDPLATYDVLIAVQEMEQLKDEIYAHLSHVRATMLSNRERWLLK